tara:strand:- start:738 stop:920 length:183 start_codon:yes stop_codon:yes gene_type:complete
MSTTVRIDKNQWKEYRDIQEKGQFNMLDPRARQMTSLSKNEWIHIITHYDDLKDEFEGGK